MKALAAGAKAMAGKGAAEIQVVVNGDTETDATGGAEAEFVEDVTGPKVEPAGAAGTSRPFSRPVAVAGNKNDAQTTQITANFTQTPSQGLPGSQDEGCISSHWK